VADAVGRVRHVRDGEPVDLTRPLRDREPARFTHTRDARRVVAAVLQVAEPLVDDRTHAVDRAAVGVGRAPVAAAIFAARSDTRADVSDNPT